MNNRDKVLKYLEDIQEESLIERYGDNYEEEFKKIKNKPWPLDAEKNKERKNEINSKESNILTTKYNLPHSSPILEPLFNKISHIATNSNLPKVKMPYIGSAHSLQFNAYAYKFFDIEEYLIVFEGELFTLANQLAKIIAFTLPYSETPDGMLQFNFGKEDAEKRIRENPIILQRFKNLVYAIYNSGQASDSKQYWLPKKFQRLQYEFGTSLELFIVGHEYGHIIGGHLEKAKSIKCMLGESKVDKFYPDWKMEYEADYYGTILLLNAVIMNEEHLQPFCLLGPELFFTFLDIQDRADSLFSEGKEQRSQGSEEHPPTFERRKRVRHYINAGMEGYVKYLDEYNALSEFLENTFEFLWDSLKKELLKK